MITANLGFPRIGADRELKWALERHWRGELDAAGLEAVARSLRAAHWQRQADAGIQRVPCGDFARYDHVLDTALALGAVPARFAEVAGAEREFVMARGAEGLPALELTKWFDTNYHHLVPELAPGQRFAYAGSPVVAHLAEAAALGVVARPVVLGPLTFLRLAKRTDGGSTGELLGAVLPAYEAWLADLVAAGATALQLDEPVLALDLEQHEWAGFGPTYERLRVAAGDVELTLTAPYGPLGPNLDLAVRLPVDVLHLDLVRGRGQLPDVLAAAPAGLGLSLGLVDGRNVWRSDLAALIGEVRAVQPRLAGRAVHVAPSCSLLHLPVDLAREEGGDDELHGWLAFAQQRLDEVVLLARAFDEASVGHDADAVLTALAASAAAVEARRSSPRVRRADVQARLAATTDVHSHRGAPHPERAARQRQRFALPPLPTTTIGSFPQTAAVRNLRARHRRGELATAEYEAALEAETLACIAAQQELGLDVLVHGELERTDMVEFFGEQLDGFATTTHGWVQSYGSRCVKPPVLYGDVARPEPMTLRWSAFAAKASTRPMKGMLTGPVTILQWSFVRDDQPEAATAWQVALALRDEVADLEAAGLGIIQIDEPALREGLPLRREGWEAYLAWATEAFRLATSGVRDDTQVHTHMCYAEFGPIIDAIAALDADVISMEASRSGMVVLEELRAAAYPNEVGPGVWDIHSPRVPGDDELDALLAQAIAVLGAERLWVNPDCGLKTRAWPEVRAALEAMVGAARRARATLP